MVLTLVVTDPMFSIKGSRICRPKVSKREFCHEPACNARGCRDTEAMIRSDQSPSRNPPRIPNKEPFQAEGTKQSWGMLEASCSLACGNCEGDVVFESASSQVRTKGAPSTCFSASNPPVRLKRIARSVAKSIVCARRRVLRLIRIGYLQSIKYPDTYRLTRERSSEWRNHGRACLNVTLGLPIL